MGLFLFGAGIFSRLSLKPVSLARLRAMGELPRPIGPTLGTQLAPPQVSCAVYLA